MSEKSLTHSIFEIKVSPNVNIQLKRLVQSLRYLNVHGGSVRKWFSRQILYSSLCA